MGDTGEDFKAWKEQSKKKRASNRERSLELLGEKGISYKEKNGGAHLVVSGAKGVVDFWPGTGKWIARYGKQGRGVFNLIKECEE